MLGNRLFHHRGCFYRFSQQNRREAVGRRRMFITPCHARPLTKVEFPRVPIAPPTSPRCKNKTVSPQYRGSYPVFYHAGKSIISPPRVLFFGIPKFFDVKQLVGVFSLPHATHIALMNSSLPNRPSDLRKSIWSVSSTLAPTWE